MTKVTAVLASFLILNACALFRPNVLPYPSGLVFPLVQGAEVSYEGEIIKSLHRQGEKLFFVTRKGRIYCVDGATQKLVWDFQSPRPLVSPLFQGQGRLYAVDDEGNLMCLDQEGALSWIQKDNAPFLPRVLEFGGKVYVVSQVATLVCLSAPEGEILWSFRSASPITTNLASWKDHVVFGTDAGKVFLLTNTGVQADVIDVAARPGPSLRVVDDDLFFGTDDRRLHGYDLQKRRWRWRVQTGGITRVPPCVVGNRILFLCWNGVLFCLKRKTGTILWWKSIPSRSDFSLGVAGDKIVVTSFSSRLVCFDIRDGSRKGEYDALQEIKSNPVWMPPHLVISLHDRLKGQGRLIFLKKDVRVELRASKPSPQEINQEIVFTATATGFHLPKFTFSLIPIQTMFLPPGIVVFGRGAEKQTVQESSDSNSWTWFPEKEGIYLIEATASDEKENAKTSLLFLIRKPEGEKQREALIKACPVEDMAQHKSRNPTEERSEPWIGMKH